MSNVPDKARFRRGAYNPHDRPTMCVRCKAAFFGRPLLRSAALHIAVTEGEWASEQYVNEQLEEFHASHG